MKTNLVFFFTLAILFEACESKKQSETSSAIPAVQVNKSTVKPLIITDTTRHDTDDPAIWINPKDPEKSLIIGTDKNEDGALYVFDLQGKIIADKVVRNLKRPNNVDIEYGLILDDNRTDIAVVTERMTHKLRIFSLPDMKVIDNGGIEVFAGEPEDKEYRDLMGIALYKNAETGKIYAIVGRKSGPAEGYLWQYELSDNGKDKVKATLVRKFGKYSGKKEIESIFVDDELGFVYYSDETVGVRKYYADPTKGNQELALFATQGFAQDHEGISMYDLGNKMGYILVSDQQANRFHIFEREGDNKFIKTVNVSTHESDGSETTSKALGKNFPKGLFVAMSDNKTFQFYRWEDIAGTDLKTK
jgi:3-phytase